MHEVSDVEIQQLRRKMRVRAVVSVLLSAAVISLLLFEEQPLVAFLLGLPLTLWASGTWSASFNAPDEILAEAIRRSQE